MKLSIGGVSLIAVLTFSLMVIILLSQILNASVLSLETVTAPVNEAQALKGFFDRGHQSRLLFIEEYVKSGLPHKDLYALQGVVFDVIQDDKNILEIKKIQTSFNVEPSNELEPSATLKEKILLYTTLCIVTIVIWRYSPEIITYIKGLISLVDLQQSLLQDLTMLDPGQSQEVYNYLFPDVTKRYK